MRIFYRLHGLFNRYIIVVLFFYYQRSIALTYFPYHCHLLFALPRLLVAELGGVEIAEFVEIKHRNGRLNRF